MSKRMYWSGMSIVALNVGVILGAFIWPERITSIRLLIAQMFVTASQMAICVPRIRSVWEDYSTQTGRCCGRHNQDHRRTQSQTCVVAYGSAENVARLSAIGNSLVPQVAAAFVRAFMDAELAAAGKGEE